jgi:hypothetical protein
MTDHHYHRATCHDCPQVHGRPRIWRETCVECLDNIVDKHRCDTGHQRIDTVIVAEPVVADVMTRQTARRAFWQARKMGLIDG